MVLTSILRDVLQNSETLRVSEDINKTVINRLFRRFEIQIGNFKLDNESFRTYNPFYLLKCDINLSVERIENLLKSLILSNRTFVDVVVNTDVRLLLKFIVAFQARGFELYGFTETIEGINLEFRND